MIRIKAIRTSLFVSLVYVGISIVSLLGVSPSGPYYWEHSYLGILFTLPVSFLGFGVLYSTKDSVFLVLVVQLLVFLIFWYLVFKYLEKKT